MFFAGGREGFEPSRRVSDVVDIYDAETDTWSTAKLSQARTWLAATTVGSKIIFAGGQSENNGPPTDVVDIYDAETDTWSTAKLSQARYILSATTLGNKALFAGGSTSQYIKSDVVDIYDAETNMWSTDRLSSARSKMGATTVGDHGTGSAGFSRSVDIYTIPEPASLSLLLLGGLAVARRRRR